MENKKNKSNVFRLELSLPIIYFSALLYLYICEEYVHMNLSKNINLLSVCLSLSFEHLEKSG